MTDLLAPIDDEMPELKPGNGSGQMMPTETKVGDIVSMRRAAVMMPRQPAEVRRQIAEMAEMFGDEWSYEFPVRSRSGKTEMITGPTVGCTMAVARAYGNCDVAHTRTEDDGNSWIIYSTFLDYQSGFSLTRGFRQRKDQATMGSDRGRSADIAFQIGVSKSTRNVVARALDDFVTYARQRARERLAGQIAKRPDEYRDRIKSYLEEIGYPLTAVEGALGAKLAACTPEQIATVVRTLTAHKDRILTDLDEVYRPRAADAPEAMPQEAAPQSRQEAAQRTPAASRPEIAPAPASAPGAAPKRRGRPPKQRPPEPEPDPRADYHEEYADRLMSEIMAAQPEEFDAILERERNGIADLPDYLRTQVVTLVQERRAEGDEPEEDDASPVADESGDPSTDPPLSPAPPDQDAYRGWLKPARAYIMNLPTVGHINRYRVEYVEEARTRFGDEAAEQVTALFDEREARLREN